MWSVTDHILHPPVQRALCSHQRSARHKTTLRIVASGQYPACLSPVPRAPMRTHRAPHDHASPSALHFQPCSPRAADTTSVSPGLHRKSKKLHRKDPN
ncbi:hypothetical protein KFK09_007641 [Dendrobium nobile]|uniref:Uncharacterized protein n=1 Tax=Dendrobium nobile TaxID=94219 RepID=A0A8T3BUN8_DENNO|nr:hypothetical protein KFK09_007641 [Dendrobium nobile]